MASSAENEHDPTTEGDESAQNASADDSAPAPLPRFAVWLVDGYNVLHAGLLNREDRSHFWSAPHRERLRARAECFGGDAGAEEIWLVFDGQRPGETVSRRTGGPRVHTLFAPSADDWLVRRIRSDANPEELVVVTGDRQVADRARHRGASVVSPRLFLSHCGGKDPAGDS